jgi:hypothetical protein
MVDEFHQILSSQRMSVYLSHPYGLAQPCAMYHPYLSTSYYRQ